MSNELKQSAIVMFDGSLESLACLFWCLNRDITIHTYCEVLENSSYASNYDKVTSILRILRKNYLKQDRLGNQHTLYINEKRSNFVKTMESFIFATDLAIQENIPYIIVDYTKNKKPFTDTLNFLYNLQVTYRLALLDNETQASRLFTIIAPLIFEEHIDKNYSMFNKVDLSEGVLNEIFEICSNEVKTQDLFYDDDYLFTDQDPGLLEQQD